MDKLNRTLLEKARAAKVKKPIGRYEKEEIDLAVAWARKEISAGAATEALGLRTASNIYYWMAPRLAQYIREKEAR